MSLVIIYIAFGMLIEKYVPFCFAELFGKEQAMVNQCEQHETSFHCCDRTACPACILYVYNMCSITIGVMVQTARAVTPFSSI